ncbi:MAG: hypothetical protein CVU42_13055 [Chloroflexi bacterium HGW-Chloroflexi-4]|jgi:hypothetical protein|nr:MAG: hypothetical protein CVU42_13055 [Chloroflexi bacterium HGW-Chloroflexi-4]
MDNLNDQNQAFEPSRPHNFEGLLWMVLIILIIAVGSIMVYRNCLPITKALGFEGPLNFDLVMSSKGLHDITLENGRAYDISYETSYKRDFIGLVRHTSPIRETSFAILTFDILVTSGDFANPEFVNTSVSNHHFTWISKTNTQPNGAINLLHTVPLNEDINQALKTVQNGDKVRITGYDIYQIQGYNPEGDYIGFWQDTGCNTTLVTNVEILNE